MIAFPASALRSRRAICLSLGTAIALVVVLLRHFGALQPIEFSLYDRFVRNNATAPEPDRPVVLVRIDESDIKKYGHPVSDELMTRILRTLLAAGPRAIGMDLYRDAPVPRADGGLGGLAKTPSYAELGALVSSDERVVMIYTLPGPNQVPRPSFVTSPAQVGFADLLLDKGGIVRRGLLFNLEEEGPAQLSLALTLALRYVGPDGLGTAPDPQNRENIKFGATVLPPFRVNLGPYAEVDHSGHQFLYDYRTAAVPPPALTLEEVVEERFDPLLLKDKVVIVGASAASLNDYFYTPFTRFSDPPETMHGLEVHAHAVEQLIRHAYGETQPLRGPALVTTVLCIWIWALLGAGLALWSRSFFLTASILGVVIFGFVQLGSLLFAAGWWLPVIPLVIAGSVSTALVAMALEVLERRERRQVVGLFSRFLRPSVADEIWRQREDFMGGDHRRAPSRRGTLTALMSDLRAYTAMSERLEPEILMAWVSEYMDAMAEEVELHQGVVDDYAGDGLKANFGFPVLSESEQEITADALRAVSCAIAMGQRMVKLNESWSSRDLPIARCRVGIFTGPTVVGCIGSEMSLKYTSVGDTVNTAARLQGFHKEEFGTEASEQPWRILIGEETRRHLNGAFQIADLGHHRLAGKADEVHIYEVLGEAPL